jgi:hypothetical protein
MVAPAYQLDNASAPFSPRFEILSYFIYPIPNAMSEGFNSGIQSLKHGARGFRPFENFRIRILFFCGQPNLCPTTH